MKKIMLVAAAAVLALSLVGCSKGGASGKKDAMNISIFTIQQREQPPADNKAYKWIEEKFGVTFSWDILVGDKDQKIGVLIASGDLPDLVEVDSEKFQGAGCLRDLKPLVEKYGPNLMKHYSSAWKQMIDQDSEKDANGNVCDTSNSYSEVTRLENNYAVKTSLKCGKNSDYKIIYIGCFENCENSGICVGEETSTGGICTNSNNKVENPEENTPNTNDNSSSSSNSNSQNVTTNSNNKSTYNKKSKSTTTNKANSNENTNKTLYQYSRCTDQYVCSEGTLTNGNVCATEKEYTYIGDVVTTTSTIPASTSTEYFTKTSNAKNSSSVTYKYIRYDKNYGYVFTKYSCNQGTISGTSCVISKPTTQCKNAGFIYNSSTGKCTKTKVETLLTPAETKNVCEVMWSYDEAVAGWTRTGNTK